MVEMNAGTINSGLYILILIAVCISGDEENNKNLEVQQKDLAEKISEKVLPDLTTCDSGKDPACKDFDNAKFHKENDVHVSETSKSKEYPFESQEEKLPHPELKIDEIHVNIGENSNVNKETEATNDLDGKDDQTVVSSPSLSDEAEVKQDEATIPEETSEQVDNAGEQFNSNTTSNSSAVVQWFRYIVEQFLEEFKDGIYSRQSEPSNSTEVANITAPLVNETVETSTENETVTETPEPADLSVNTTETANTTDTKKTKFHCTGRNVTDNSNATVKLITSARLLQLLAFDKNETENMTDCLLVMFYAPWCQFCARTAPHYNAVARAFPQLDFVAVDTAQFSNLLARFGTVSVPNILVFHQSRAAVKFNQTERIFENFVSFIQNATGLEPNTTVNVTEADYLGPIASVPTDDPDYLLLISWIFVIFCSSFMFIKSQKGQQWITRVRILWQEHQHID